MYRIAIPLVCAAFLACADAAPAPWPGSEVATLESGRLTEVVRLGGVEGPEETTFGTVLAIRPVPGGGFHVADGQPPIIRRYSAAGEFLGTLGRSGEGPGEYRFVVGLGSLDDGRTVVVDGANMRVTVFETAGNVDHSVPHQPRATGYQNRVNAATGDLFGIVPPHNLPSREPPFRLDRGRGSASTGRSSSCARSPPKIEPRRTSCCRAPRWRTPSRR